jgi:hypothetical protein
MTETVGAPVPGWWLKTGDRSRSFQGFSQNRPSLQPPASSPKGSAT